MIRPQNQAPGPQLDQRILDALFENSFEAVAILDKNFNFIRVNKVYAADNNRTTGEYPGKNHFDLYPSDAKSIFEKVVATKKPVEILSRPFYSPDNPEAGITYWDWTLRPCLDQSGEIEFLILCLRNVTAKQRLENEVNRLDRLNLVGEMAASIGHEIRNPLTTVRGYLQWILSRKQITIDQDTLTLLIEELDRANSIITEFLSLAKNKISNFTEDTLSQVIKNILPLIHSNAHECSCMLHVQYNDTHTVRIDEKEIRQLILNLTKNSFEAMPGGGNVYIETYENNENVLLSIRDTGSGIPEAIREHLGTPFITTKESGTGLGLPVCYRIVERHAATMSINSSPHGTTFVIAFPIVHPPV